MDFATPTKQIINTAFNDAVLIIILLPNIILVF